MDTPTAFQNIKYMLRQPEKYLHAYEGISPINNRNWTLKDTFAACSYTTRVDDQNHPQLKVQTEYPISKF